MKILIALADALPSHIQDALVNDRKFWRDLPMRLKKLPSIKKGINIAIMPKATVHDNAVAYAKKNKLVLHVGYIIHRSNVNDPWKIEVHSFCVDKNNRVIEPTEGFNWRESHYVGIPVKEDDIRGMRYLNYFEKMDYIHKAIGGDA